ncbi:sulfurtransferase TusA [Vibrio mediterranei]|uniref:sulfurtransferase TusA n=1 Tax=Vibrio mediterranei TaxID=689 RepID=UPI004067D47C
MKQIDLCGLKCPEPVMMVRKHVRKLGSGEQITFIADDPSTTRDFEKFCIFNDHVMVSKSVDQTPYTYTIQKG